MIKQIKRAEDIDLGGKIIAMGHRLERTITSLFPKLVGDGVIQFLIKCDNDKIKEDHSGKQKLTSTMGFCMLNY